MLCSKVWTFAHRPDMPRPFEPHDDTTELPDALQFMQLLWALVHGLERRSKQMGVEIGITGPQRLVVRVVGLFPGVSAGDLARVLHVHPSTLTGILQRLIAQGLLGRVEHEGDRRRAVLHLTARGERANRTRRGTVESAITEALAELTPSERAVSRRVLAALTRHLEPGRPLRRRPRRRSTP